MPAKCGSPPPPSYNDIHMFRDHHSNTTPESHHHPRQQKDEQPPPPPPPPHFVHSDVVLDQVDGGGGVSAYPAPPPPIPLHSRSPSGHDALLSELRDTQFFRQQAGASPLSLQSDSPPSPVHTPADSCGASTTYSLFSFGDIENYARQLPEPRKSTNKSAPSKSLGEFDFHLRRDFHSPSKPRTIHGVAACSDPSWKQEPPSHAPNPSAPTEHVKRVVSLLPPHLSLPHASMPPQFVQGSRSPPQKQQQFPVGYEAYRPPPPAPPVEVEQPQQPIASNSLSTVILPLLSQLKDQHSSSSVSTGSQRSEAIDELRNAFDLVERSSPGITDDLVSELIGRLAGQTLNETEVQMAISKCKGSSGVRLY
ncbi:hypothetical protein CAPTEDRAFT_219261 [Capitella teleta]|uniref:Programmed cell death protein 10 dimerisation domain-containing protein n=1 Tax=Capitella teleta TaxID=283909 RepID=R7UCQ5_CAPTE|nr:hypothetical protein CAPTEDRAFT_219261 [Capitella teleta]|eukprot:ELU01027.1 hypothetical protein CAPTEDRAFT_219261 [Capitella teleta]